jgi:hypothetical protein
MFIDPSLLGRQRRVLKDCRYSLRLQGFRREKSNIRDQPGVVGWRVGCRVFAYLLIAAAA